MDLSTLSSNLENGTYASKDEFFEDTNLIFDNAVAFNKGRPNSGFVLTMAKKMSQLFEREKKKLLKRGSIVDAGEAGTSGGGSKKIKLSLKRGSSMGADVKSAAEDVQEDERRRTSMTGGGKKIKLKINRGKQLPEGAVASSTTSSKLATYTAPSNSSTTLEDFTKIAPMNPSRKAQCYKVLSGLKRRQAANVKEFLKPVSDPKLVKDYRDRIEFPMDLGTITSK